MENIDSRAENNNFCAIQFDYFEESLQKFCSDFLSLQSEYAISVLNFQLIQLFSKLFKINGTKLHFHASNR